MGTFAVIDTETNWADQVMSIGCCLADTETFQILGTKYHILMPEITVGGMYSSALLPKDLRPIVCTREEAAADLLAWFSAQGVRSLFAYNASFDRNHLPELSSLAWHDIMRLAAYRQHNPKIPCTAPVCSTGRLKRGFGVEPMLRLLSEDPTYHETHNALLDALDELEILRLLRHPLSDYPML